MTSPSAPKTTSSFDHLDGIARWWEEYQYRGRHHLGREHAKRVARMSPWINEFGGTAVSVDRWLALPGTTMPMVEKQYYTMNCRILLPTMSILVKDYGAVATMMVAPPTHGIDPIIAAKEAKDSRNDNDDGTWTPFNGDGYIDDARLAAEGFVHIGRLSEDSEITRV